MKKPIEKTDCDCYLVIDTVRGIDRISICCIKKATEEYHVAEDYCIYDGGISFEDAIYSWPVSKRVPARLISKRKYSQLVESIEVIRSKVLTLPTEGNVVRRECLQTGDCIKISTGFIQLTGIDGDDFEALEIIIDEWRAAKCNNIKGSISENLPDEVLLVDSKGLFYAEEILRSSAEELKNAIIKEFKHTR
jgi:hypothetical protein